MSTTPRHSSRTSGPVRRAARPRRSPGRGAALWLAVVLGAPGAALAQAPVQDRTSLDQRVQRIERMVESSAMVQLLESVKSLQREVRELRGQIEVQNHAVEQLKRRQRELYADVDRRLQSAESAAPPPRPGAPPPAPPPSGSTASSSPPAASPAAGTPAAPAANVAATDVDSVAEQGAYQAAFNLLKDGRYEQAAEAFRAFLGRYAGGRYADNAQYWLGETFYGMRRFDDAVREFETLLGRYPESQKRPHAMLKLGYAQAELGKTADARATLELLVQRYPDSTAAGLARKRLGRLGG